MRLDYPPRQGTMPAGPAGHTGFTNTGREEGAMKATTAIVWGGVLALALAGCSDPGLQAPQEQPKGPKAVECRWAPGKIKIDGVLNDIAWDAAEELEFTVPWQTRKPKTATKARLLWDKDYLYFCADMED